MSVDPRCPSCGHVNDAQATDCAQCGFPLAEAAPVAPAPPAAPAPTPAAEQAPESAPAAPVASEPPARPFDPSIRRARPVRPRPPRPAQQGLQVQLWIALGGAALVLLLFTAFQGFRKNNQPAPVAGAAQDQQHIVDMARAELAKDSTNVNARILLANMLYDTGNWSEAIVHYKSALRTDPGRIETIVDMGVCYFNLSQADEAIALFRRALELDPKHTITLFNLGIVSEQQNRPAEALDYYRRARATAAEPERQQALDEAIQRVQAKSRGGSSAPQ